MGPWRHIHHEFRNEEIIPMDAAPVALPQIDNVGDAVATALQLRPELRALAAQQIRLKQAQVLAPDSGIISARSATVSDS